MFEKRKLPLIIFCLLILILSVLASISPWWEASTTKENEILNRKQLKVEYWLEGSVSAYKIDADHQITALKLKGTLKIDNETITVENEKGVIRIPTRLGLGTFYSTFEGNAYVTQSEQGYFIDFVGVVKVDNVTFPLNLTYSTKEKLDLKKEAYSVSFELELTTTPVTISAMALDSKEDAKYQVKSFLDTILILNVASLGLNVTVLALILLYMLTGKTPFYKVLRYIMIIAIVIPLTTFLLFASNIQGLISKLNNVAPSEVYTLQGSNIKALFGGAGEVVYGPSLGWKMVFVIFIMNAALFGLVSKIRKEEGVKS